MADDTQKAPEAGFRERHRHRVQRHHRADRALFARQAPRDAYDSATSVTARDVRAEITRARSNSAFDSKRMLRIEIQTSDPNIRIIWFAPKENDFHQSKPATD